MKSGDNPGDYFACSKTHDAHQLSGAGHHFFRPQAAFFQEEASVIVAALGMVQLSVAKNDLDGINLLCL